MILFLKPCRRCALSFDGAVCWERITGVDRPRFWGPPPPPPPPRSEGTIVEILERAHEGSWWAPLIIIENGIAYVGGR